MLKQPQGPDFHFEISSYSRQAINIGCVVEKQIVCESAIYVLEI